MKITLNPRQPLETIRPELYGHCADPLASGVDDGIWVGQDSPIANFGGIRTDVLDALRQLHPPVLRWPGGSYAHDYHWEDGVGPRAARPRRVNLAGGQTVETNGFGTHEFIQVCRTLGAEPYLAANTGSAIPREFRDWVEYCNFAGDSTLARRRAANGSPVPLGVRYWGLGEAGAAFGRYFSPEEHADQFKRFAAYAGEFGGVRPYLIARGPDRADADWTRQFFRGLDGFPRIGGFAAPYSCGTVGPAALTFDAHPWYELLDNALGVEKFISEQRAIFDEFDPQRNIGLVIDGWGARHSPSPSLNPTGPGRQNTLRDALAAALTLDAFNRNADKLVMATIAQMVNGLQTMLLTQGDKMVMTPTYHVFEMYRSHQGARRLPIRIDAPFISLSNDAQVRQLPGLIGSASLKADLLTLSVVNCHVTLPAESALDFGGGRLQNATVSVLTHPDLAAHNTFESPRTLIPQTGPWEPLDHHLFPPASVTVIRGLLTD